MAVFAGLLVVGQGTSAGLLANGFDLANQLADTHLIGKASRQFGVRIHGRWLAVKGRQAAHRLLDVSETSS